MAGQERLESAHVTTRSVRSFLIAENGHSAASESARSRLSGGIEVGGSGVIERPVHVVAPSLIETTDFRASRHEKAAAIKLTAAAEVGRFLWLELWRCSRRIEHSASAREIAIRSGQSKRTGDTINPDFGVADRTVIDLPSDHAVGDTKEANGQPALFRATDEARNLSGAAVGSQI